MKFLLVAFLFLIIGTVTCFGQSYSVVVDSLTVKYVNRLSKRKQAYFNLLIQDRLRTGCTLRLNNTDFDYAFIEEIIHKDDSIPRTIERYFIASDSIPIRVMTEGLNYKPSELYDTNSTWTKQKGNNQNTLFQLINKYSSLKNVQKLTYNKTQLMMCGCVYSRFSRRQFTRDTKKAIRSNYQILTMVDKINHIVVVSIQFPPKFPKIEVIEHNVVWDF